MKIDRQALRESWQSWLSSDLQPVGPAWLQWVWTVLFSAALAVVFTLVGFLAFARGDGAWRNLEGWLYWYSRNLIICLSVGVCIHLLFRLAARLIGGDRQLRGWRPWQRTGLFAGLPLLGVAIGWPLGLLLAGNDVRVWFSSRDGANLAFGSVAVSLLLTFLMHHFFAAKARQIDAERRATEAQLRLLQGQMEPHFLFNTLAGVSALIEHDAARARQTLDAFTDYLRASLATLRRDEASLGQELDLAEQYLQLMQARMEDRLSYRIDADEQARRALLPPMLLQPLVENAIRHGLEPSVRGGQVQVQARAQGDRLHIDVRDDGLGLQAATRGGSSGGHGVALANLRERLRSRYGSRAQLDLQDADPGTLVRLSLPLELQP